jgi:DNA repair exonuclease SbcCD ATPase subunit
MIIEGFEIENWTCIKKLAVSGLPPTGVIVLHGPNRTGKSSVVQALRACLMDYSSTSTALKSCYPRGGGEKPIVSVTFSAGATTYRVKKCFGSNKSELAGRTSTGDWKVETTSAAESHSQTCGYVGGDDSSKGLRQLLWLTQAEFRLPDPKKFDAGVQAQLRGILGVLQTALDDLFIERVKKRWNSWYSGQRKVGKQHEIKDSCTLAEKLKKLDVTQLELKESDGKFNEIEGLLRQTAELELRKLDFERQLGQQTMELRNRQEELQRSQTRIGARRLAEEQNTNAVNEQKPALEEKGHRADAVKRLIEAENAVQPGKNKVDTLEQSLRSMEERQTKLRKDITDQRENRRALEQRANRVTAKLLALDDTEDLKLAQKELERVQEIAREVDAIKRYLREYPAPDKKELDALKTNRQLALQLQADRDAASMSLKLMPIEGAGPAQLVLDGAPLQSVEHSPLPLTYSVRRKAEVLIPAWGRVELRRGTSTSDLDQIEADLGRCHEQFASGVVPFGITANDPNAFEQLLRRHAENGLKNQELKRQGGELKKLAPKGLEPLQRKVLELETKVKGVAATDTGSPELLPSERNELKELKADFDNQIALLDGQITVLEADIESAETALGQGRTDVTRAKEELAGFEATVKNRQEELGRLRTEEQIAQRVDDAKRNLEATQAQLTETELTNEESTIDERLAAAEEAVRALEKQIRENEEKYNRIKGRLEGSEGLHSRRASLAARVDELARLTERESIEKDAVDRLYELFEECREKQLGTLMGPIHERVLNWMRVLDIGD